ncbi:ankyrin repeat domain-containing protein [Acidovorax sp.]|uniref:ankyrin repeat domain-containing protein n=1 Tax=Acidovorax sp. TaxID=1872122 RepID=UPI003918F5EE
MSKQDTPETDLEEKLSEAQDRELIDIIDCDDAERMKQLLDQGMPAEHRLTSLWAMTALQNEGRTVPQMVIARNALKVADHVFDRLSKNWNLDTKNALIFAVQDGTSDMVRLMIGKGFDPDKKSYQEPPFWHAVVKGRYDICEALLSSGQCNPYAKTGHAAALWLDGKPVHLEKTPIGEAIRQGRLDIVKLIVEFKLNKAALADAAEVAVKYHQEDIALYLLDKLHAGRKPGDTRNYPARMALWAAERGMFHIAERLMEKEPRVLQLLVNNDSLVCAAARRGDFEQVQQLVAMGAEIQAKNTSNFYVYDGKEFLTCEAAKGTRHAQYPLSPLYQAAENGHLEIVKYLVERGVLPYETSLIGYCEARGHTEVAEYLKSLSSP